MIDIREVGPRDGLQAEKPVAVEKRVEFIQQLIAAGVNHVEIASFMRDDLVPSMAGADQVVASVPAQVGLTRVGLVANTMGAERAVTCGLDEITITVSLSDTYSRKNTGKSSQDAMKITGEVVNLIDGKVPTDAVVSCAFGSPYADVSMQHDLPAFVDELKQLGCARVTLADTTGEATPRLIREALNPGTDVGSTCMRHAELDGKCTCRARSGRRRFDCSLGGIGDSRRRCGGECGHRNSCVLAP